MGPCKATALHRLMWPLPRDTSENRRRGRPTSGHCAPQTVPAGELGGAEESSVVQWLGWTVRDAASGTDCDSGAELMGRA